MNLSTSLWDARKTELELPEEIDLQLEMANAGSRTLAILVDLALCGMVLFVVYGFTALIMGDRTGDFISRIGGHILVILFLLLIFGVQWVYFTFFEWIWNGQTPGKRLLRLRVIKVDGTPVSGIDVLLRNLSRPIDTFGPMGLIGLLMIFIGRKAQRLGDLMAQTLVIHETAIDWSIFDEIKSPAGATPGSAIRAPAIHLTSVQWELLHRYLNRRENLQADTRQRLALSLYESLKPLVKGTDLELSPLPPEDWLVELARRT